MRTAFTPETVPALGTSVKIARDFETPNGVKFTKGESAVIAEHKMSADGDVSVGARTRDPPRGGDRDMSHAQHDKPTRAS
jgi:hypothetical protein